MISVCGTRGVRPDQQGDRRQRDAGDLSESNLIDLPASTMSLSEQSSPAG
jgi:hypothetical protein